MPSRAQCCEEALKTLLRMLRKSFWGTFSGSKAPGKGSLFGGSSAAGSLFGWRLGNAGSSLSSSGSVAILLGGTSGSGLFKRSSGSSSASLFGGCASSGNLFGTTFTIGSLSDCSSGSSKQGILCCQELKNVLVQRLKARARAIADCMIRSSGSSLLRTVVASWMDITWEGRLAIATERERPT